MPNFVCFATSTAGLAHAEKSRTQSINQSPSLFDAPGTEALALRNYTFAAYGHFTVMVKTYNTNKSK